MGLTTLAKRIPFFGLILTLLASFSLATAGLINKLLVDVNPVICVIARSLVQLIVALIAIQLGRSKENSIPLEGVKGERLANFMRACLGYIATMTKYEALRLIPIAEASTIFFSSPVYVTVIACIVLKEAFGIFQVLVMVITLSGAVLISRPGFLFGAVPTTLAYPSHELGIGIAFASAISTSFVFITTRKLQKTPSSVVIVWLSALAVVFGLLECLFQIFALGFTIKMPKTLIEFGLLIAIGICGVAGQFFLTAALKVEEAGLVSLGRTFDIVLSFIYQLAFYHNDRVDWVAIAGALLVCSGVLIGGFRKQFLKRQFEREALQAVNQSDVNDVNLAAVK